MRRLIFAAGLALIIHGLLLWLEVDWLQSDRQPADKPEPLSVTLSYRQPEKPIVPEPPVPPIAKKAPEEKPEKKHIKKPFKKTIKKLPVIIKEPELIKPEPEEPPPVSPKDIIPEDSVKIPEHKTDLPLLPQEEIAEETYQDIITAIPVIQETPVSKPSPPPLKEAYPVYNSNPAPKYPKAAKRRGYEGVVTLDVFVDKTGKVGELNISQSSGHEILDNAAISSVKDWLFEPGKRGEEKIEMWVKVPIRFELK